MFSALILTLVMQDEGRDAVPVLVGASLRMYRNAVGCGRLLGMPLVKAPDANR